MGVVQHVLGWDRMGHEVGASCTGHGMTDPSSTPLSV